MFVSDFFTRLHYFICHFLSIYWFTFIIYIRQIQSCTFKKKIQYSAGNFNRLTMKKIVWIVECFFSAYHHPSMSLMYKSLRAKFEHQSIFQIKCEYLEALNVQFSKVFGAVGNPKLVKLRRFDYFPLWLPAMPFFNWIKCIRSNPNI